MEGDFSPGINLAHSKVTIKYSANGKLEEKRPFEDV